ncbi:MAG: type IX secretion system protein PorQ [Flavobacteriia bacterium]|nr:type IX secretion system protein PorQ [Flavobacteriia bacterium]
MKKILTILLVSFGSISIAQTGGTTTFALLDLGYSARSNALGTDFISVKDQDVNLGVSNPSLYNTKMHKTMGINQALLAGGINYGMFTYAHNLKKTGTLAGHLRYIDYGKMDRMEVNGTKSGTFTPTEYILGAGLGKQLNPQISVGANLNLIYSQLETYNAFGASIDLAGCYTVEKHNLLVTALVKNAGFQFKSYVKGNRSPLPTEFQMAISHKLAHAPLRFSILAHHLILPIK